jgi:hypothetical protein
MGWTRIYGAKKMRLLLISILFISTQVFSLDIFYKDSLKISGLDIYDSVTSQFIIINRGDKKSIKELKLKGDDVATRFCNYISWIIAKDDTKEITYYIDKLRRRESTFFPTDSFKIEPSHILSIGDSSSPIEVVAYMSADCGYCKQTGIALVDLVKGPLKGKLKFSMKPIHKMIGDFAFVAANEQGKTWEIFREFANSSSRIDNDLIYDILPNTTIDSTKFWFDMRMHHDQYEQELIANREEGLVNGVKYTPTLYFNGRRYRSNRHPLWIIDYVEFLLSSIKK